MPERRHRGLGVLRAQASGRAKQEHRVERAGRAAEGPLQGQGELVQRRGRVVEGAGGQGVQDGPRTPSFETVLEPQLLLAATFNSVITSPARLRRLLDVCALAARGRVERILAGPEVNAAQVASAVSERLDATR